MTELCLRPHVFLRRPEFAMIWGVYASTYLTANLVITTCERAQMDNRWPKFSATTLVNMAACISKVREPASLFLLKCNCIQYWFKIQISSQFCQQVFPLGHPPTSSTLTRVAGRFTDWMSLILTRVESPSIIVSTLGPRRGT